MLLNVKGFVLFSTNYRDSDRLVTLLTREYGLITCAARRAAQGKSNLRSLTIPFVFAEYELFHNRERYTINNAQLIEGFQHLADTPERLTAAAHLAEIYRDLLRDDVPSKVAYELWPHTLWQLSNTDDPLLIVSIAQLRILSSLGFAPNVQDQQLKKNYFSFIDGRLSSRQEIMDTHINSGIRLQPANIALLKTLPEIPLQGLFNACLKAISSEKQRENFLTFAADYLNHIMEKRYTKLDKLHEYQQLNNIAEQIRREDTSGK